MLAKADVFIQNLKPGAVAKLGFAIERLRRDYPKLICCSISGFGESGPLRERASPTICWCRPRAGSPR